MDTRNAFYYNCNSRLVGGGGGGVPVFLSILIEQAASGCFIHTSSCVHLDSDYNQSALKGLMIVIIILISAIHSVRWRGKNKSERN